MDVVKDALEDPGATGGPVVGGLPSAEELAGLDGPELERVLADVERLRRRVESVLAMGVARADESGLFRADGHRTVRAWEQAALNVSPTTALRISRNGAVLDALPVLRDACLAGEVPVDVLDVFGRLWANPRVRNQLRADIDLLVGVVRLGWFSDVERVLRRWEALADPDGAVRSEADAHASRAVRIRIVGAQGVITGQCGAADAVLLREILERFTDAEFLADVDEARFRTGRDEVTAHELPRTSQQRRFDALQAIMVTAAAGAPAVIGVEPLVNIRVDQATAEDWLRRMAGEEVPHPSSSEVLIRHCETVDGTQLPGEVMAAALVVGRFRGVLTDGRGVVTHLGRRSRLFRGGAKDAAILGDRSCFWVGCNVPTQRCQTDHSVPYSTAGPTDPSNAGRGCGHHNRWKHRGYRTVRRGDGTWDIYRPDGTRIGHHIRPAA